MGERKIASQISGHAGHTLIELVIVLCILGLSFAALGMALQHGVDRAKSRGAGQVWQVAGLWAQHRQLSEGGRISLQVGPLGAALEADPIARDELSISPSFWDSSANVARWRQYPHVVVTFGGLYASPDSGGSLLLGKEQSLRVLIRPETGFSRREWHVP